MCDQSDSPTRVAAGLAFALAHAAVSTAEAFPCPRSFLEDREFIMNSDGRESAAFFFSEGDTVGYFFYLTVS